MQHDYAVFGFGETEAVAIAMAAQWLKDEKAQQGCNFERKRVKRFWQRHCSLHTEQYGYCL